MKKIFVVLITALLVLVGCSNDGGDAAKDSYKICANLKSTSNPYYLEVMDGLKAEIKEGDEFILTDSQEDQAKQINDVEDFIQQGCDIIYISPVDWQGTRSMLEAAKAANIPTVILDQNIPEADQEIASAIVISDNYGAGKLIGESMAKALDGKGSIVIYENTLSNAGVQRIAGFEDFMKDYPEIKVVNRQDGIGQIEASLPVMENMLQANPEITAVFAFNDPSAIGCISAIDSAGLIENIKVFGVDGSKAGVEMIEEGKMFASAVQFPAKQGSTAIQIGYKLLAGETVDKVNFIPVELVDSTNIEKYKN